MEAIPQLTCEALEIVLSELPQHDRRRGLGDVLLKLLEADIFVSFTCDATGPYADPVQVNQGDDMLLAYQQHFKHVDQLTPLLFRNASTRNITPDPSNNEFVHDFLHPNDMYHGMNYHAANAAEGSIDLRIWRGKRSTPFTDSEGRTLRVFGDLITRVWTEKSPHESTNLTPREKQIAGLVALGWADKRICKELSISHATLRTHLSHAFEKTGALNRAGLATFYHHHQK